MRWQHDNSARRVPAGRLRPGPFDRACRTACATIAVTIGLVGLDSRPASAEMITNFDGVAGSWTLDSDGLDGDLSFLAAFTTKLNGSLLTAPGVATTILNFTLDATSGVGGVYSFDPTSYSAGLTYVETPVTAEAVFDLELSTLTITTPNSMQIEGTIELNSNTSSEDFSAFAIGPGDVVFTLNVPPGLYDLVDVIENGDIATGSGSFSAISVPEPSSIALIGLALTGFVLAFRRRLGPRGR